MNDFINIVMRYATDSFMSIFVLGVLTGWLIEWIFYNLFWKQRGNKAVTKDEAEAKPSNKVVDESKDLEKEQQPVKTNEVEKKQIEKVEQQEPKVKDKWVEPEVKKSEEKQSADKQDAETENSEKNQTDQTEKTEKVEVASPNKPAKQKEKMTQKKSSKKASKPIKADDFTKLYGVGPSLAKSLKEIGVDSFKQLSELSTDELVEQLIANGSKAINKGALESWAKQAKFADAGDVDGLKAFQNALKKG